MTRKINEQVRQLSVEHAGQIVGAREPEKDYAKNQYSHAREKEIVVATIAVPNCAGCHGSLETRSVCCPWVQQCQDCTRRGLPASGICAGGVLACLSKQEVGWGVLRVSRWGGKKPRDRLLEFRGCKNIFPSRNPRFGASEPSEQLVLFQKRGGGVCARRSAFMVTPLQPRQFFRGIWTGNGELVPHPLLRWFWRRKHFRHWSESIWLSATIWLVKDRFEFSSGRIVERKMFCELVAPDRVHVSADDMPLGADVELHETGLRFAPYDVLVARRGRVYKLRFLDECRIDESGFLHSTVKMYLWGSHIATMRLGPLSRNLPREQPAVLHFASSKGTGFNY